MLYFFNRSFEQTWLSVVVFFCPVWKTRQWWTYRERTDCRVELTQQILWQVEPPQRVREVHHLLGLFRSLFCSHTSDPRSKKIHRYHSCIEICIFLLFWGTFSLPWMNSIKSRGRQELETEKEGDENMLSYYDLVSVCSLISISDDADGRCVLCWL